MKSGNSDHKGSDLDKGNILKPTFNTMMEEGHRAFEAYHTNLKELFLSRCKVTRQRTALWDTTLIVFNKSEVTPEVRFDPLPSHNDIQAMMNSVLERQGKSTDELLRRLVEERNEKKLTLLVLILLLLLLALLVLLKLIHHYRKRGYIPQLFYITRYQGI
jgi:hypothetical protein